MTVPVVLLRVGWLYLSFWFAVCLGKWKRMVSYFGTVLPKYVTGARLKWINLSHFKAL